MWCLIYKTQSLSCALKLINSPAEEKNHSCNKNDHIFLYHYLVAPRESPLWLFLPFYPKTLRCWEWYILILLIQVLRILKVGGNTQNLPAIIEFIWTFLHSRGGEDAKTSCSRPSCLLTPAPNPTTHPVKVSLPNI